jgi:hypothetical protein
MSTRFEVHGECDTPMQTPRDGGDLKGALSHKAITQVGRYDIGAKGSKQDVSNSLHDN